MFKVVYFEIPCDNLSRAIKFYQQVFGWKMEKWEGPEEYWMINFGRSREEGIDGGLYRRKKRVHNSEPNAYLCTISVPNVDEYVAKVKTAGGRIIEKKTEIPGWGWYAVLKDTESNQFAIMEHK